MNCLVLVLCLYICLLSLKSYFYCTFTRLTLFWKTVDFCTVLRILYVMVPQHYFPRLGVWASLILFWWYDLNPMRFNGIMTQYISTIGNVNFVMVLANFHLCLQKYARDIQIQKILFTLFDFWVIQNVVCIVDTHRATSSFFISFLHWFSRHLIMPRTVEHQPRVKIADWSITSCEHCKSILFSTISCLIWLCLKYDFSFFSI